MTTVFKNRLCLGTGFLVNELFCDIIKVNLVFCYISQGEEEGCIRLNYIEGDVTERKQDGCSTQGKSLPYPKTEIVTLREAIKCDLSDSLKGKELAIATSGVFYRASINKDTKELPTRILPFYQVVKSRRLNSIEGGLYTE